MIEGGGGSGLGVFPDIPRGAPGDIASAADHLTRAGDHMHDVAAGLRATVDGLGQDWSGDAAGRYRRTAGGLGRNGPLRTKSLAERMREGRAAGEAASADRQVAIRAARARALRGLIRGVRRIGVKVPQGLEDLASHGYEYASRYKYRVVFRLLQIRGAVAGRGAAGAALARAIDRLLGGG